MCGGGDLFFSILSNSSFALFGNLILNKRLYVDIYLQERQFFLHSDIYFIILNNVSLLNSKNQIRILNLF